MPVLLSELKQILEKGLKDAKVSVEDLVGDGDHLQATIISPDFAGKSLLQQHKLVYQVLGDLLKSELHALKLQTFSPQQWERRNQ